MSRNAKLFVIVVGCGRLGSYLANRLSREGHSLVTIDRDAAAFNALFPEYRGVRVEGDATEVETLRSARVDRADLVVATTHSDNVNIMVTQVAKKLFGVPRVMARVFDVGREEVYRSLGVETISPMSAAGELFLQALHKDEIPDTGRNSK